ncbi:MAG: FAD-dependent oxidoreductase [Myxococcota bacterium]
MSAAQVEVLVVGSGAGGATTALELATRGRDVLVLEEGLDLSAGGYGRTPPEGMRTLYRQRGMAPIVGPAPIGYVEGCCVGGSTEINSGFWHRTPREILLRWKSQFDLADSSPEELAPHFEWAERQVGIAKFPGPHPKSTQVFERGIRAMGWSGEEVPRTAPGCQSTNRCAQGCASGAKQGMSRSLLPRAREAGVRVLSGCRVDNLIRRRDRIVGVVATLREQDGVRRQVRIDAEHVFVCCGPTETPALLRRSGIKHRVGNSLRIHPMLKVVAHFDERIDAHESVLPLLQVKEFWPEISLGGSFFTPGHVAMALSENWSELASEMADYRNMASYYVAVKGVGRGSVRPNLLDQGAPLIRYSLTRDDLRHLSAGLARLSALLLAAGAKAVYPSVQGLPAIRSEIEAVRWLDEMLPRSLLSLTTVHAFSSCPMGERHGRCATDSFGRVTRFENLHVNDASLLPDSPGVNPQGSVMAFARRNAVRFAEEAS